MPASAPTLQPPAGLKAFMLRATEPAGHVFSRTPSFAWTPVAGAAHYEFELATSKRFSENSVIWSEDAVKVPAESVPVALPWITGQSYSLYAHVRAVLRNGRYTPWSSAYGFNMRWTAVPQPMTPSYPGLVRWTTVAGADAYQVWFTDVGKWFTTTTNVADEREYYTFHQSAPWMSTVHWRVRPVRMLYGATANGLPAVSYGPWSPIYTSVNPPFATGPLAAVGTISGSTVSNAIAPASHDLMPAFLFTGNQDLYGVQQELYHVYVFTDQDCLNMVFSGSLVGSPAYAPRPTGPLALPTDAAGIATARTSYLADGAEPPIYTYDYMRIPSTEAGAGSSSGSTPPSGGGGAPSVNTVVGAKVDLWDTDWPTGRYYWTVMPVKAQTAANVGTTLSVSAPAGSPSITVANASVFAAGDSLDVGSGPSKETVVVTAINGSVLTLATPLKSFHVQGEPVVHQAGALDYRDTELTQDACASGRVLTFGKSSQPVVTGSTDAPYVSGLSPRGQLFSATTLKPRVYGSPLVAWEPALGADQYEVQYGRSSSFAGAKTVQTYGTSTTLPLAPGTWYYRVRGLDFLVPNKQQMSWSDPVTLVVAKPTFRVVHSR